MKQLSLIAMLALTAGWLQAAEPTTSASTEPAPRWVSGGPGFSRGMEMFGDAAQVALLAELVKDPEPQTREQALCDLGQTHNASALPVLRQALRDTEPMVRIAAIKAALELSQGDWQAIVVAGLADENPSVAVAAVEAVRVGRIDGAAGELVKLLDRDAPVLQQHVLRCLNEQGLAAGADTLGRLLASTSPAVRAAAVGNAARLEASSAAGLSERLNAMAAGDVGEVRAEAMASLGRLWPSQNIALFQEGLSDKDPIVRRGALRALQDAGRKEPIRRMLDDPSPLVQLAAIRAAGELKCADCIEKLFDLMRNSPSSLTHEGARESLVRIGGDPCASLAGAMVSAERERPEVLARQLAEARERLAAAIKEAPQVEARIRQLSGSRSNKAGKPPAQVAQEQKDYDQAVARQAELQQLIPQFQEQVRSLSLGNTMAIRNLRSACWLLGRLGSQVAVAERMEILQNLRSDNEILVDVAISLGKSKVQPAVGRLREIVDDLLKQAPLFLSPFPAEGSYYNSEVIIGALEALGELQDRESLQRMILVSRTRVADGRLSSETQAAIRGMVVLMTPQTRPQIEAVVSALILDPAFSAEVRFEAIRVSGQTNFQAALPNLRKLLEPTDATTNPLGRSDRQTMRAAAWAIGRLTGQVPAIPDPAVNRGEWIIQPVK